jgi:AcrR family transcriptional regulator
MNAAATGKPEPQSSAASAAVEVGPRGVGRPRRHEEESQLRAEQILEAATRFFARYGYANTDVQMIADELSIGKGTIYRHFPTKQELFFAAVDRGMDRLLKQVERDKALVSDPIDQIRNAIRSYFRFFDDNRDLLELFVQERSEFKGREKSTYFVYKEKNQAPKRENLRQLIQDGIMRQLPVDSVSEVLGALLYGAIFTAHFSGDPRPLSERADDYADILLKGLLSDDERIKRRNEKNQSNDQSSQGKQ